MTKGREISGGNTLFLKVIKEHATAFPYSSIFAVRLVSCKTNIIPYEYEKENFLKNHMQAHLKLINSLYTSNPTKTFDLRFVFFPEGYLLSGKVEIGFLVKVSGNSEEESREEAINFSKEFLALLKGGLQDYEFELVDEEEKFNSIYKPFDFNFNAEICRRENLISLKTEKYKSYSLATFESFDWSKKDYVYFVHPFIPYPNNFSRLIRILLNLSFPILMSIRLKPVALTKEEKEGLQMEIEKCEKYAKEISGESLRLRAFVVGEKIEKYFYSLIDAPFHLTIQVSSPQPFSQHILEAIGTEITECPVRNLSGKEELLSGGYDIFFVKEEKEKEKFVRNLEELGTDSWRDSLAPPSLKRLKFLFDPYEALSAFHLPVPINEDLPGINTIRFKSVPPPSEIFSLNKEDSILIGLGKYGGKTVDVYLSDIDRKHHVYCVGQTGTGKTTFLKKMILEDIKNGRGVIVIDPHGDLFKELLALIPDKREDDVVVFDPYDSEYPVGFNILDCPKNQKYFIVREFRSIMERILESYYGVSSGEYAGPVFYQHMQMNLLLVMSNPSEPGTLLDFYNIYRKSDYWRKWEGIEHEDPQLKDWVENVLPNTDYLTRSSGNMSWGEYLSSKFDDFIFDPKLRLIFAQRRSTIDIKKIMDEEKILLVNLAKGEISESNTRFLGMILMSKILSSAMERVSIPQQERKPCYIYIDEFQNISTGSFVHLLSEARKFGLILILANQFVSQIKDERITNAIFGNVGTIVSFRVGQMDANILKEYFFPVFDLNDLTNIPDWHACVKTKVKGKPLFPFTIQTIPPDYSKLDNKKAERIREKSRNNYGVPKEKVLKMLEESNK
jgi:hypothetical protein